MLSSDRRARRRGARALVAACAAVLVSGLVLSACSDDDGPGVAGTPPPSAATPAAGVDDPADDPALERFYQQKLAWAECQETLQCAKLTVPVDWAEPAGATFTVGVARYPAEGERIGSLVINPGGPGASGISYAKVAPQAFRRGLLESFDIVGFDPRGVGESSQATCLTGAALEEYLRADGTPDDAAELQDRIRREQAYAAACEKNTGELARHVDTLSVVRDMDVLRAALGESRLTYHGVSYGTYLGAWYAQTFPWRVGRFTLDGAVDPSLTSAQYGAGQAEGFSRALRAFVENCLSERGCPLRGSLQDGLNQIGLLVDAADADPLRTDQGRTLTQSLMFTGIVQGLYDDSLWPALEIGLANALEGDGTGLLRLADVYLERAEDGSYGGLVASNATAFCLDVAEERSPEQIRTDADELGRRFPPLGSAIGWGSLGCATWPIDPVMPRRPLPAEGAAPILVLGTTNDPATPYEWAKALASQLSSGQLLTWEGSVHTAYNQGSECVDDAVETYLLSGKLPPVDTRCT